MIEMSGRRIVLDPAPTRTSAPAMTAVAIGHCPGRVRPERLSVSCREQLELLGLGDAVRIIAAGAPASDAASDPASGADEPASMPRRARTLRHLPLMFENFAQLTDCFPEAETAATTYGGPVTGQSAWLPAVAADFFRSGGLRLWVVVVDDGDRDAFLPTGVDLGRASIEELTGVDLVAHLDDAALLLVPDLERLFVPADLRDVPPLAPPPPSTEFEPCPEGAAIRLAAPGPATARQVPRGIGTFDEAVVALLRFLRRWRPDVQLLVGAPLSFDRALERPGLDRSTWSRVQEAPGELLRHLQPLFPFLRDGGRGLRTPAGVIAGAICRVAERGTPWQSIAGTPIAAAASPYPRVRTRDVARLRDELDLGVLVPIAGGVILDDERTPRPSVPVVPDFAGSAEVVRLFGWLRRRLVELGNRLVFHADVGDPRPELALRQFFQRLHQAGALRGRTAAEAFELRSEGGGQDRIEFTIVVAPAYPIDRLVLTFVADRGRSAVEVRDG